MKRLSAILCASALVTGLAAILTGCETAQQNADMGATFNSLGQASGTTKGALQGTLLGAIFGELSQEQASQGQPPQQSQSPSQQEPPPPPSSGVTLAGGNIFWGPPQQHYDSIQGYGRMWEYSSGAVYEGEFRNGWWVGGTLTFPDGRKFEGEYKDGLPTSGKMTYPDGRLEMGYWEFPGTHAPLPSGKWVTQAPAQYQPQQVLSEPNVGDTQNVTEMLMNNGARYTGLWKLHQDNLWYPEGQGTETWPTGEKYVGDFHDGKRNGQGTQTWATGEKYVGEWHDDNKNGQGTLTWATGEKYVGEWHDAHENGQGTYTWPTGDKYVGEFHDGKRNGQGSQTSSSGVIQAGLWQDDKFVVETKLTTYPVPTAQQNATPIASRFGTLNITSDILNCEVYVDGKFVGGSPAKLKLAEGSHTIEVKKSGCKDYRREIAVIEDSELTLHPVLEKQ